MLVNTTRAFDSSILLYDHIEASNVISLSEEITKFQLNNEIDWLLKSISLIDLTTLSGDDTFVNVHRLCMRAKNPLSRCVVEMLTNNHNWDLGQLTTAAVCVYPNHVKTCADIFKKCNLPNFRVASVASGFPSGQYGLESRLTEIKFAIENGSSEIDIVINRTLVLEGDWLGLYDEVKAMRSVCGNRAHLKTILATGELYSYDNVYKASMVCMLAGADFIKTSTGKETTNATLPVSLVMARAIRDFHELFGVKIGFKPAGGLRTFQDALNYLKLIYMFLGPDWLNPDLLRLGASSLLDSIECRLFKLCNPESALLPGQLDHCC